MQNNGNTIDPTIKALAQAIKKQETGSSKDAYNQKGASGEIGAYQFMPDTWKSMSAKHLGNENAPMSIENQNRVAYNQIKEWKDKGYNPAQIAAAWNAGEGKVANDAWKNNVGVNSKGVKYDTPNYVKNVSKYYKEYSSKVQQPSNKLVANKINNPPVNNITKEFLTGVGSAAKENLYDPFANRLKAIDYTGQNSALNAYEVGGAVVGGGIDVLGKGLLGAAKRVTPQPVQDAVSTGVGKVAEGVSNAIPDSVKSSVTQFKQEHPQLSGFIDATLNYASVLPAGKAAELFKGITTVGKAATEAKLASTAGKMVQGSIEDIKPAVSTLKSIPTKGVKNYTDLSSKIQGGINTNLKKVTTELSKDKTGYGLQDFTRSPGKVGEKGLSTQGSKGGITTNYVQNAMESLKNLANKTKDVSLAQEVQDYGNKLQSKTFTRNDANELSKLYARSEGAFGKSGDLLKGTSPQLRENIRKGLKSLAFENMSPEIAKLEKLTSDSISTKELTDKMKENVNKSVQKARETGIFKKTLEKVVDIADTLSGHIVSTVLRRLAQTSTGGLSAKEIEAELSKNLKTFNRLIEEGNKNKLKDFLKGVGYGTSAIVVNKVAGPK